MYALMCLLTSLVLTGMAQDLGLGFGLAGLLSTEAVAPMLRSLTMYYPLRVDDARLWLRWTDCSVTVPAKIRGTSAMASSISGTLQMKAVDTCVPVC